MGRTGNEASSGGLYFPKFGHSLFKLQCFIDALWSFLSGKKSWMKVINVSLKCCNGKFEQLQLSEKM